MPATGNWRPATGVRAAGAVQSTDRLTVAKTVKKRRSSKKSRAATKRRAAKKTRAASKSGAARKRRAAKKSGRRSSRKVASRPQSTPPKESPQDDQAAYVETLIATGQATPLTSEGKLPPGATHEIIEDDQGQVKVVRRRFSIT